MKGIEKSEGPAEIWLPVSAELIAGVHHALNNRVGALSAVAQVLEGEMGPRHPLRTALVQEVERLHLTVQALTLLPTRAGAEPEPIHLPDLLPDVVELFGYHHGVRDTECTVEGVGDVLPLCCEPTLLAHLLVTLLVTVGEVARAAGASVRLRYEGDAQWVTVTIAATADVGGEPGLSTETLRRWAADLGGEAAVEGPGRYVIRLPTLPEVRRREIEGESGLPGAR